MDSYEDFMKQYGAEFEYEGVATQTADTDDYDVKKQLEAYKEENKKLRTNIARLQKVVHETTVELEASAENHPTVHLRSMAQICKVFGKGRETVKRWYEQGAPIAFDGFSYFAEYRELMNWLIGNSK